MPEGRVAIDHHRPAIQITYSLDGLVILADDHLFVHMIKRHRKSHLLESISTNSQITDSNIPLTLNQGGDQLGKVIDQYQFGN